MESSGKDEQEEIWIKHYSSEHQILLVGEGDFSFSACLAKAFGNAPNIIATSFDSEVALEAKYPAAESNLKLLKDRRSTTLHEVDVRNMCDHPSLVDMSFDRIVFNFPHAGFFGREHEAHQIQLHQGVVHSFLKSARNMLSVDGQVHVTHKTSYPFFLWGIEELGKEVGLRLVEKVPFYLWDYPGYTNRKGSDNGVSRRSRSNATFPVGECSTFMFEKITLTQVIVI